MNAQLANRKAALESQLSKICGVEIEITIRSLSAFTVSAEGNAIKALDKAKAFLSMTGALTGWKAQFDEECECSFAYFNLNA